MANLDPEFDLVAVVNRRGEKFDIEESDLHEYFVPKRGTVVTQGLLRERGKGIGYVKLASNYIFRRIPSDSGV